MTSKHFLLTFIFITAWSISFSQHQDVSEKPGIWKGKENKAKDTSSLLSAFKLGHTEGHFRYFFMATDNQTGLTDYYANAAGGGIRFETLKFKGFQFAVSGFFVFNVGSSDFEKPDSITKQFNRYELALFDVENPKNHKDIDRLEEMYLKYNYRQSTVRFGRQLINTPFINLQDGRMRPTGVEGVWLEMNEFKKVKVEGGFLYAISPRGTTRWYYSGASVGVFPMGVTTTGTKSNYLDNISSEGVAMLGVKISAAPWLNIKLWDLYFDQIQNTSMIQADFNFKTKNKSSVIGGLQLIHQDALGFGGNEEPGKTYVNKGAVATTFGGKLGWKTKKLDISANYNRITKQGRYLMPREWGRDPFYTFLPRERNEGFGDVHALMGKLNYDFPKARVKSSLALGYYKLPDVKNFELNKYGMPSYTQINADFRYTFEGIMQGLEAQLLIVTKLKNGETYNSKNFEINKVNMTLYNLVLNYHF